MGSQYNYDRQEMARIEIAQARKLIRLMERAIDPNVKARLLLRVQAAQQRALSWTR